VGDISERARARLFVFPAANLLALRGLRRVPSSLNARRRISGPRRAAEGCAAIEQGGWAVGDAKRDMGSVENACSPTELRDGNLQVERVCRALEFTEGGIARAIGCGVLVRHRGLLLCDLGAVFLACGACHSPQALAPPPKKSFFCFFLLVSPKCSKKKRLILRGSKRSKGPLPC
jgi:hypothetical protein